MALDHYYLNLAFHLALQNEGNTAPNPSVGAVVVRHDAMVSYGYHERAGAPHAEAVALRAAGDSARGATLYCTLEPCAHHGKTPPCVEAIRDAGVRRVVYAARDQNPLVNGKGHDRLGSFGIEAEHRPCGHIEAFYAPFFRTFRLQHPYVLAKVAMTANGIISPADRNSRWITNETSLAWVHQLRAQCDAILVGADTVILDRPHLTVRAEGITRRPLRIVLDSRFKLTPEGCSLLESDVPILICGLEGAPAGKEKVWVDDRVRTLRFKTIAELLSNLLVDFGIRKVLIEGGQKIFTLFHTAGLIDEYILMTAPRLLMGKHFLNVLGGPDQSLSEASRYRMRPPLQLDGDTILRMQTHV